MYPPQYMLKMKEKIGWATSLFPMHSSNQFGTYYCHCVSRYCDFPLPPCIYNYQKKSIIIELDYHPIHHLYLFLLTIWHSQTWKGWHHHNIIIWLLNIKIIKLCLIPFTTKISHITIFFVLEYSSIPSPLTPLGHYNIIFINALP